MVALGDIAEINPRLPEKPGSDELVSFLPTASLGTDGTTKGGEERPFGEVSKGYTPFLDGDLLIAKITPCFQNNKIGQARISHGVGVGSTEFHVVRPRPEVADARYLLHFLRRKQVRTAGERRMTGSGGQRRVPADFLQELEMPLPPLSEQRQIAAILDHAESLVVMRRQLASLNDSLVQALFREMFGEPMSNSGHLPLTTLDQLGDLDRGVSRHRPRNDPALLGGPHPLVQTGEVANSGGFIRDYTSTYSDLGLAQSKKWPAGTLCITIAANIARTGVLTFDACSQIALSDSLPTGTRRAMSACGFRSSRPPWKHPHRNPPRRTSISRSCGRCQYPFHPPNSSLHSAVRSTL